MKTQQELRHDAIIEQTLRGIEAALKQKNIILQRILETLQRIEVKTK